MSPNVACARLSTLRVILVQAALSFIDHAYAREVESNQDWVSRSDPEAKIAKMKNGTTHLAYKPEHAVDLDTGAVVAAELHPADEGDDTLPKKQTSRRWIGADGRRSGRMCDR